MFASTEADAKEADKVTEQLQSTGISSGGGDGAASSGIIYNTSTYIRMHLCICSIRLFLCVLYE